jgi:hypothetical protein
VVNNDGFAVCVLPQLGQGIGWESEVGNAGLRQRENKPPALDPSKLLVANDRVNHACGPAGGLYQYTSYYETKLHGQSASTVHVPLSRTPSGS